MCFGAFVVNSVIWLQVYWPRLSLFPTPSCIVTYLPMRFYIWTLFNSFLLLYCYCLLLCNLSLLLLLSVVFLFLMVVVPLIIRAEEDVVVRGILTTRSTSPVIIITVATLVIYEGNWQQRSNQNSSPNQWPRTR